jgi:hypothetical protein
MHEHQLCSFIHIHLTYYNFKLNLLIYLYYLEALHKHGIHK